MLLWIWTSNYTFKRLSFLPGTSTGLVHDFDHICIVLSGKKKNTPPYCFLFVILSPLILHIKSVLYFTHPIFKVVVIYQTRIFYTRSSNFFFFVAMKADSVRVFFPFNKLFFFCFGWGEVLEACHWSSIFLWIENKRGNSDPYCITKPVIPLLRPAVW